MVIAKTSNIIVRDLELCIEGQNKKEISDEEIWFASVGFGFG